MPDVVFEPVVNKCVAHRLIHKDPRAIFNNHIRHLLAEAVFLVAGKQVTHLLVEFVKFRIGVVGMVGAGRCIGTVEKLKEIFGVGIVGHPTELEHLRLSAIHFIEEGGPVVVPGFEDNTYFFEQVGQQVDLLLNAGRSAELKRQFQTATGFGIDAVRIACFRQKLFGFFDIIGVRSRLRFKPGHWMGNRAVDGCDAPVVVLNEHLRIKCAGDRLPQLFVFPDNGVIHVEANVVEVERRLRQQSDFLLFEPVDQCVVRRDDCVPVVAVNPGEAELTGQEHHPLGGLIVHDELNNPVEKRELFARIVQQSGGAVFVGPFRRIELHAPGLHPFGVADKFNAVVALPLMKPIRAGADGMVDEPLAIELNGFARDGEAVVHGKHPEQLRVRAGQLNLQGAIIECAQALHHRVVVGRRVAFGGGAKFIESDNPFVEGPVTGGGHFDIRNAFNGINKILRRQLAALSVGEAGVILKNNALADFKGVGQTIAGDLGRRFGQQWLDAVRAIQIGVLQQPFVDTGNRHRGRHIAGFGGIETLNAGSLAVKHLLIGKTKRVELLPSAGRKKKG